MQSLRKILNFIGAFNVARKKRSKNNSTYITDIENVPFAISKFLKGTYARESVLPKVSTFARSIHRFQR